MTPTRGRTCRLPETQDNAKPFRENGIESRHAWLPPLEGTQRFTTEEESSDPANAGIDTNFTSFQHPDHDTPTRWRPKRG